MKLEKNDIFPNHYEGKQKTKKQKMITNWI